MKEKKNIKKKMVVHHKWKVKKMGENPTGGGQARRTHGDHGGENEEGHRGGQTNRQAERQTKGEQRTERHGQGHGTWDMDKDRHTV